MALVFKLTVSWLEQKKKGSLSKVSSALGTFPTSVQSTDLLILLIRTIWFSYRKADMGRKHSRSSTTNYRRLLSSHASRMSSPAFSQDQGSCLSFSVITAWFCSGHCSTLLQFAYTSPALRARSQTSATPLRQLPSCTGRIAEMLRTAPPAFHPADSTDRRTIVLAQLNSQNTTEAGTGSQRIGATRHKSPPGTASVSSSRRSAFPANSLNHFFRV